MEACFQLAGACLLPGLRFSLPRRALPPAHVTTLSLSDPAQRSTAADARRWFQAELKALWAVRWHNCHKDTLWRLAVRGVPGAGGHDVSPRAPCACGWAPLQEEAAAQAAGAAAAAAQDPAARQAATALQSDAAGALAAAWQEHYYWSCPVARDVVRQLQRALPAGTDVQRAHVWLVSTPTPTCLQEAWRVVCLAAVSAMNLGRRVLWAITHEGQAEGQPGDGLRQLTLEELGFVVRQAQELAPEPEVTPVQRAGRRAAAEFWALLQDFASLQSGAEEEGGRPMGLHAGHPFLCTQDGVRGVRVTVPPPVP